MAVPVRCLRRLAGLPRRHPPARHCSSLTPKALYQSRLDGGELHVDEHQSAVVEHLERLHSRLKKYDLFHCMSTKVFIFYDFNIHLSIGRARGKECYVK